MKPAVPMSAAAPMNVAAPVVPGGPGVERVVRRIIERVRRGGDAALARLTRRLDGAGRRSPEVGAAERAAGARRVDRGTHAALRLAARRIAVFARRQRASIRPFRAVDGSFVLEQRLLPVRRVGVYVPGGRHPLASSVLMGAVPARVAGCEEVVLCTPPRRDGSIAPEILAAAAIAGVDRVFAAGGAQSIAALAFGTESVPAVDLIVGPGNRYVAAAKAVLAGRVGIDFVAGPTELLVIADETADPERVAADLIAQAEHDPQACLTLVRVGKALRGFSATLRRRLAETLPGGGAGRAAAEASLARLTVRSAPTLEAACGLADRLAPEHLSLQVASPRAAGRRLRAYGSLFLGGGAAVALGDYVAGPNHVLPTGGAARHTGGLSALRFLRVVTVQEARRSGAPRVLLAGARLAGAEGMRAHAASIELRLGGRRRRRAAPRPAAPAVLFDFNGVLMDDEDLHWRACREVVAPLGIRLSRARYDARYLAFDDRTALRAILGDAGRGPAGGGAGGRRGPGAWLDDLVRRKRRRFRLLCEARGVRIEPGSAALVRALARRAPLAIVSGAARPEILRALARARLRPLFRTIVSAEDVRRSKPDPEGYRLALARLGFAAGKGSVAIEDSPGGIRAARAAGLRVVGITSTYPAGVLRRAGAARTAPALAALAPEEVLGGRNPG